MGFTLHLLICLCVTSVHRMVDAHVADDVNRIWNVAIGHDWGAHEYIDARGILAGFNIDVVSAVCEAANMDCRTVWAPYTDCMTSVAGQHAQGGQALLDGWVDACMAWSVTTTRIQMFSFSDAFMAFTYSHFYVLTTGSDFTSADINTIGKIGFMDGWASDEKCVARVFGLTLATDKIIHSLTFADLLQNLQGVTAALFAADVDMDPYEQSGQVKKVTGIPGQRCIIRGHGMMTRKDNRFNRYFNEGLAKIISTGRYRKICDQAVATHGSKGVVKCLEV